MSDPAPRFSDVVLPERHDVVAPDGSLVRLLASLPAGSMAHFELAPGGVSLPQVHRTVSEIWFVTGGRGVMWREQDGVAEELVLRPGVSLTIPVSTSFQFRNDGAEALTAVAVTMPPWPGDAEAVAVAGPWPPAVGGGSSGP